MLIIPCLRQFNCQYIGNESVLLLLILFDCRQQLQSSSTIVKRFFRGEENQMGLSGEEPQNFYEHEGD